MALFKAGSLLLNATLDAASVVWMELAMFFVAATVYLFYLGASPRPRLGDGKAGKASPAARAGDGRAALAAWQRAKGGRQDLQVDLVEVVEAMRKLGRAAPDIIQELRSALDTGSPSILAAVSALPASLLRDDAAELLDGTLRLLEERGHLAEPAVYAGLMGAQLRRRDAAGAVATAARLPSEALTPKIRGLLAAAATLRGRLDEALGHLRGVPAPGEGVRCPLAPGAVMQLLGLALREGRAAAVAQELQRVHARMEPRHLEDLLADGRRKGPEAVKDVLEAARVLKVERPSDHPGSARQASAAGGAGAAGGEVQRQAALLRAHGRDRDLPAATAAFRRLQASGVALGPMVYNCYLDACVQCGDLEAASAHFEDMKRLDLVDVVGYNTMLKAHLSRGHTEKAQALLREMAARGLEANKVTYNELLHAKVLAKDCRGSWQVVDEMRQAGVRANSVTCSILLKSLTAHSSAGDVGRILALIDELEEQVDEVLYSSAIETLIRIRQLDALTDMMRRHRARGGFKELSAPTYGSMIKAYGQAGQVRRVHELWGEMEDRGVKPTSITLGCMTEALVTNGEAEEALVLLHEQLQSEEKRGCINTVIYSTVLKGFALAGSVDKVFSVYQEMRSNDIACNTITYNTILDACAKSRAMSRAGQLLADMKETCVEPDIITYSTIVKGCCLEGDVDRAFHVLDEMKSDGKFAPDEIMYNSILDGCAKSHRVDDALRVLEEMKAAGVGPSNYTLSIMVKLLGHARKLNQAFRMVEELSQQNGFRLNVQVYTCLVQACVLNRRLDRAMGLHDTMVADPGCKTDEKFYGVLARGCLQLHQPLKAVEVVRAAYHLEGHSLAVPAGRGAHPAGMEARSRDEVARSLRQGGAQEQAALARLEADLLELRGVRLCDARAGGDRPGGGARGGERRRPGGGGGGRARGA